MRRFWLLVAAAALALVPAAAAQAAAPRYIMVTGSGIEQPILLDNWRQNLTIMLELANAPRALAQEVPVAGAPRLDLSLFWGWGSQLPPNRPGQRNQYGWLYPADGERAAVIKIAGRYGRGPRIVPARLLRILERAGVPVRG